LPLFLIHDAAILSYTDFPLVPKRVTLQSQAAKLTAGYLAMEDKTELKQKIKAMMVENLMLQVKPEEITDDMPLFGPGGLGLDSVDALQLVVGLDKSFGLKVPDPAAAKQILHSVSSMAEAIANKA
jgi:acyl carrier protein